MDIRHGSPSEWTSSSHHSATPLNRCLPFSQLTSTELLDGLHSSPEHALRLHKDIRSRHTLGMHFATFAGSDVEAREPVAELIAEKEKLEVGDWMDEGGFGVIDVGDTAVIAVGNDLKGS